MVATDKVNLGAYIFVGVFILGEGEKLINMIKTTNYYLLAYYYYTSYLRIYMAERNRRATIAGAANNR